MTMSGFPLALISRATSLRPEMLLWRPFLSTTISSSIFGLYSMTCCNFSSITYVI